MERVVSPLVAVKDIVIVSLHGSWLVNLPPDEPPARKGLLTPNFWGVRHGGRFTSHESMNGGVCVSFFLDPHGFHV